MGQPALWGEIGDGDEQLRCFPELQSQRPGRGREPPRSACKARAFGFLGREGHSRGRSLARPVARRGERLRGVRGAGGPAFLRLFQATPWNGDRAALPAFPRLRCSNRSASAPSSPTRTTTFEGCPFVGLDAYGTDQAQLFFGRQMETLDALACFDTRPGSPTVRWLEINGNSGSGKSSLMNAGLLPLVDQGWLWPRTGYAHWRRIGPMMPGAHPVEMLAEYLARAFDAKMGAIVKELEEGDDAAALLAARTQSGRHRLPARHRSVRGAVHLRRPGRAGPLRPSARHRAGGCRLPAVRHFHRARRLPRPLRRPAAAGRRTQPTGQGHGRCRRSASTACARSSTARPGSPASM